MPLWQCWHTLGEFWVYYKIIRFIQAVVKSEAVTINLVNILQNCCFSYDMEDAMILNKSSVDRGLCRGHIYQVSHPFHLCIV